MKSMNNRNRCIFCGVLLDSSNQTKEHIFLEAMGDQLTSKDIICVSCNNKAGDKIDGPFANQLKELTRFYQIKGRDKDTRIKCTSEDGLEYYFDFCNKIKPQLVHPVVKRENNVLSVTGRSVEEVKSIVKRYYKRHHLDVSKIDWDSAISIEKNQHPKLIFELEPIDLNIFAFDLTKMAVEFDAFANINPIMFDKSVQTLSVLLRMPEIVNNDLYKISYSLIELITYLHIQGGIAPKIDNSDRKMKAILYMYKKQLYCEISILGTFTYVVPLLSKLNVNQYIVTTGDNSIISSYNVENDEYLKNYKMTAV